MLRERNYGSAAFLASGAGQCLLREISSIFSSSSSFLLRSEMSLAKYTVSLRFRRGPRIRLSTHSPITESPNLSELEGPSQEFPSFARRKVQEYVRDRPWFPVLHGRPGVQCISGRPRLMLDTRTASRRSYSRNKISPVDGERRIRRTLRRKAIPLPASAASR